MRSLLNGGIKFLLENSLFLIAGTVVALIWANFGNCEKYERIIHGQFHFMVNDVFMCFFFGIAAKEIWEALLPGGDLNPLSKAATPIIATIGGMAGPAGIYVCGALLFGSHELMRGWAIPCATDIAFSYMFARMVFGRKHPAIKFLLLLAIADDAGGLVILAVFYPAGEINLFVFFSAVAGAVCFNIAVVRKLAPKSFWLYLIVAGPLSWYGFFKGGIHPALALVPIIPTLPHEKWRNKPDHHAFEEERYTHTDPLNAFEHWWKNPVELILMLFGFANAGVKFSAVGIPTSLVSAGLLVGKPLGITVLTLVAVKCFGLRLPNGMDFRHVFTLGILAGVGFTVALFVATVAFPLGETLDAAKMGALFSFFAALLGIILGKLIGIRKE